MKKLILILCILIGLAGSAWGNYTDGVWTTHDFGSGRVVLYAYTGAGGAVVIPAKLNDDVTITEIYDDVFSSNTSLTSITFASGSAYTKISAGAFRGCSNLSSITFPSTLTTISGSYSFRNCTSLTSITIPANVTSIGVGAFYGCTGLTTVNLGSGIMALLDQAFRDCTALTAAHFSGNAPTFGDYVFYAVGSGFKIYYCSTATGWTTPFYTYTAESEVCGATTTVTTTTTTSATTTTTSATTTTTSIYVPGACTVTAANCSSSALQTLITAASPQDTICVPADNCTWTATVIVNKPVTIQTTGAVISGGLADGLFKIDAFSSEYLTRITGFKFYITGGWSYPGITVLNGSNHKIRVDHCTFNEGDTQVWWQSLYGLVDHNTFINGSFAMQFTAGTRANQDASWDNMSAGTANALIVEDNTILDTAAIRGEPAEKIGTYGGGRLVIRYNTFDSTAVTADYRVSPIMTHGSAAGGVSYGYWQANTGARRGQSLVEIYNNTMHGNYYAQPITLRGSANLVYNNTITWLAGACYIALREEEYDGGQWTPTRQVWPAEDQIHNTFIWNNTSNGNPITTSNILHNPDVDDCSASATPWPCCTGSKTGTCNNLVKLNQDYFAHAPCGAADTTDAYGNTCTHGKETFTNKNGASGSYPTDGTVYANQGTMQFTATGDNAYYGYKPYTYPHPLSSGAAEYTYTLGADNATITGYTGAGGSPLVIPTSFEGKSTRAFATNAFKNNTGITSVTIPDNVTSIGDFAFQGCTNLDNLTIPTKVLTIGSGSFTNCTKLHEVTIGDNVTTIGHSAFLGDDNMTSIHIPVSVTSIGPSAFKGCSKLDNATFCGIAPSLGQAAFDNTKAGFKVRYIAGKGGFTVPYFTDYTVQTWAGTGVCTVTQTITCYHDADSDTYGDPAHSTTNTETCTGAYVTNSGDCADDNATVHATHVSYRDADGDGYGAAGTTSSYCKGGVPAGYIITNSTDCNDALNTVTIGNRYYRDSDSDTFGNPTSSVYYCPDEVHTGWVTNSNDCNDTISGRGATTWYTDQDKDGYGVVSGGCGDAVEACTNPTDPEDSMGRVYVATSTDCDDTDATINPGATELCNGIDDNCNGQTDENWTPVPDTDTTCGVGACASTGKNRCVAGVVTDSCTPSSGITEFCDGQDNDCDGTVDEGCSYAAGSKKKLIWSIADRPTDFIYYRELWQQGK